MVATFHRMQRNVVIFRESARDADIIFCGLAAPEEDFTAYYEHTRSVISGMPTTVLVLARPGTDFSEVLQEAGD